MFFIQVVIIAVCTATKGLTEGLEVVGLDALPVVRDCDGGLAMIHKLHLNMSGSRIHAVLHQFLDSDTQTAQEDID